MNDCFWYSIGVCDGESCNCEKYISMNSIGGDIIKTVYQKGIDNAIKPIREEWLTKFYEYEEKSNDN